MKRYDSYKDSGVKWLGEIPSHWEAVPIKKCFSESETGLWGEEPLKDGYDSICIRVADFDYEKGIINNKKLTPRHYSILPTKKKLQKGDLLLEKSGGGNVFPVGRVVRYNLEDLDATCSNFIQKLRTRSSVNSYYLFYLFSSMYSKKVNGLYFNQTTGIQNLKIKEFLSQIIFLPNYDEQEAIANYLDAATSKIDEAIAQQQKMIDLLNERKQIIINNAVTKGLDPNVKMKPSGIDWIGDIPEHWEVYKIKNLISLLTDYDANGSFSDIAKNCNINTGTPYAWMVRTTDLVNKRYGIVEGNNYCDLKTYNYLSKSSLNSGDLLMTKRGNVGQVYVVPECDNPMTLAPNLYLLRTLKGLVNNKFLMFYLSSFKPQGQLALLNKSTTLGALYKDDVKAMNVILPPIDVQNQIVDWIETRCLDIDEASNSFMKQISLLQERKQIIINDVVTGKVKVV